MRMRVCYIDSHEAGLYCYLETHIENLLYPLQLFYFHLWPIYWLSLVGTHPYEHSYVSEAIITAKWDFFPAYISTVRHLKIVNKAKKCKENFNLLDYKENRVSKNEVHNNIRKVEFWNISYHLVKKYYYPLCFPKILQIRIY
jgi:hypothetical protein